MSKIKQEENGILKGMGSGWKWLARESNGNLYKHSEKPMKLPTRKDETQTWLKMDGSNFRFIKSTDEPHNIQELIEEYEIENGMRYDFGKIKLVDIDTSKIATHNGDFYVKESEETEVKKDIEWLKKEIENMAYTTIKRAYMDDYISISKKGVLELINQLDEPETLSEYLIEQKSIGTHVDTINGEVQVTFRLDDLENLLLPEQEKVEVPRFVAEYLDEKKECPIYKLIDSHLIYDVYDELARWLYHNDKKTNKERELSLVLAHIYGYELEKEKKYHAKIKGWENVTTGSEAFNWVYFKEKDTVGISKAVENKYQAVSFTKCDWNNLGINEDNADFVLVEELEEYENV